MPFHSKAVIGSRFYRELPEEPSGFVGQRWGARRIAFKGGQVVVAGGPYVTIMPVNRAFVCVPVWDPLVVFYPPRPGFFIGGAIGFGFGITLGFAFAPWGWGSSHFFWD
jgi:hypothetical protein